MNFLEPWYEALSSPFGIVVESDNPKAAKEKLYAARREAGDTDLEALSIVTSPVSPEQFWIIKRKANGSQEGTRASAEGDT